MPRSNNTDSFGDGELIRATAKTIENLLDQLKRANSIYEELSGRPYKAARTSKRTPKSAELSPDELEAAGTKAIAFLTKHSGRSVESSEIAEVIGTTKVAQALRAVPDQATHWDVVKGTPARNRKYRYKQ